MAVVEGGGGGGGYCSIDAIINETQPMTVSVLYSPKIVKEDVINAISTLKQDASGNTDSAGTLMNDIRGVLQGTNSERFHNGTVATTQRGYMDTIDDDITNLLTTFADIDVQRIGTIIDKYNTKLVLLKKQTRLKLLQEKADQINAEKRVVETRTYDETYYTIDNPMIPCPYRDKNIDDIYFDTWSANIENSSDGLYQTFHWTYTRTVRIKYWVGIKCIDPFKLDDDATKLEQKFNKLGIALPYTRIVDMD